MAEGSGRGDRALFETGEGRNVGAERSGARIGDAASHTGYGAGGAPPGGTRAFLQSLDGGRAEMEASRQMGGGRGRGAAARTPAEGVSARAPSAAAQAAQSAAGPSFGEGALQGFVRAMERRAGPGAGRQASGGGGRGAASRAPAPAAEVAAGAPRERTAGRRARSRSLERVHLEGTRTRRSVWCRRQGSCPQRRWRPSWEGRPGKVCLVAKRGNGGGLLGGPKLLGGMTAGEPRLRDGGGGAAAARLDGPLR